MIAIRLSARRWTSTLVGLAALILSGCQPPVQSQDLSVTVSLPEAYELANIILALTEYGQSDPWEVRKDFPYYSEMMEHFSPHTDHALLAQVNYSRERWREYLSFRTDAVAFEFNEVGQLERVTDFATHDDISPFDDHLALINDFVQVSDFRRFFAQHATYYESIAADYADYYMIGPMLRFLREYVAEETSGQGHAIVLSPLVYRMNAHRDLNDSTSADFPTLADYLVGKGGVSSDAKARAIDVHTLFTEIDHGFINPVSASNADYINGQFDHATWQVNAGYDSPLSTFNEYMTWAVFDLFAEEYFSEYASEVSLYWHYQNKNRGFIYSEIFAQKLKELYRRRSRRSRLGDLYPEMLEWVGRIQSSLSQPALVPMAESVTVPCGVPTTLSLEFSEPMEMADSFTVIIQDGRTRLDTLLLTRAAHNLDWSSDGLSVAFQSAIPAVDDPHLVFNWWGSPVPLRSQTGILLESPSYIQVVCE